MSRAAPFGVGGTSLQQWQASAELAQVPWLPVATLIPPAARLVVLAPHPDDEVLACGGLLAAMAARQDDVLLIAVTDGEASHPGTPGLAARRQAESEYALARLGFYVPRLKCQRLAMADGQVAVGERQLVAHLIEQLRPGDYLLSTWRHDGHCDHEAAGRSAAQAAAATGATLLEMPVWAWHWATPDDPRIPWQRAHKLQLSPAHLARKRHAIQAHISQLHSTAGQPAVLSPATLERLMQPYELVFT